MLDYEIVKNLTIRKISDEQFVLDRNTGTVHSFNGTGGFIWEKIASNMPFSEIVNELIKEFDIAEQTAKSDIFDFFLEIQDKKLIIIRN